MVQKHQVANNKHFNCFVNFRKCFSVSVSQRPLQRAKSESMLSDSLERQGLREEFSKTAFTRTLL